MEAQAGVTSRCPCRTAQDWVGDQTISFLPGLELCRRLYQEAVRPLLEEYFPKLPYAAARIGPGSDVLGFDTEMSMDQEWGPQLQLFLREQDLPLAHALDELFGTHLPHVFLVANSCKHDWLMTLITPLRSPIGRASPHKNCWK